MNKLDNNEINNIYEFYELGLGEPMPISAEHSKGIGDLLDEVVKNIEMIPEEDEYSQHVKIALVGKPGKRSIAN